MTNSRSLAELAPAYGAAFDEYVTGWSPARRALGRAVLSWLLDTPPQNSVRPRRSGDELEWRLITHDEWSALRLALVETIAVHSNAELILTVLAIKDFHVTAYQHLPADVVERLRSPQAAVQL